MHMKKFLVLYRSAVSARAQMAAATPEQTKAGMDAWMKWAKKNEKMIEKMIVDLGSPLGDSKRLEGQSADKGDETISGFSIVQGESLQAVTKAFADHPHTHMPGKSSIEVIELLPVHGM